MTFSSEFLGEKTPQAEFKRRMHADLSSALDAAKDGDLLPELKEALESILNDIEIVKKG